MSEPHTPDEHIQEAQKHLTNAREMKENDQTKIRALAKARESVQRAIDKLNRPDSVLQEPVYWLRPLAWPLPLSPGGTGNVEH